MWKSCFEKNIGVFMLFEDAVFTQRGKENTLFQKRIHACIIDMLYYLLYVKIYENTFYNIVRAKFEIKTKSQAYILPQLRITVHSLFFLGKDRRHLSPFTFSYTFGVPPTSFAVYILFKWPHSSNWFHNWLRYIAIVRLKLSFCKSKELIMLKILWITLQFCLFEVTANII